MFAKFIYLEWKSFLRSASFASNLVMKILIGFLILYFSVIFLAMGVGVFYVLREMKLDPLATVNKYLLYYFFLDLIFRLMLQSIPVMNIRPLLIMPFKRSTIVNFSLAKTALSFFNTTHAFFFVPFCIVLLIEGYDAISVFVWGIGLFAMIYCNNFLNVLLNNKDKLFAVFVVVTTVFGACQYYNLFDITYYSSPIFEALFHTRWVFIIPILTLIGLYYWSYTYFKGDLYLDAGLAIKKDIAKTENLSWLNQFGTLGTFLKNDIKLIKRNKRSKATIWASVLFLFYGLIFFNNPTQPEVMYIFAGIFVSGGFLFTFGQFVPSWDSSYYQLMMTQNIPYRVYLNSKWWLIVIATVVSTILASFYLYYGWQIYLTIVAGAIYNIGVNSHLVLLGGAFTKTPIDLSMSKGAFGDKKSFNVNTMLLSLPKMVLPLLLYWLGSYFMSPKVGLVLVASAGVLGFVFRNIVFSLIEKIYKREKYKTVEAYKQKA